MNPRTSVCTALIVTYLAQFGTACTDDTKAPPDDNFTKFQGGGKSDAFSSDMKLLGSLTYGQTSDPVAYSKPATYRAFTFTGGGGDALDIRVQSPNGGDSVAWLLDDKFNILAQNDDADGTLNSHITYTVPKEIATGMFYVVFRDYSYRSTTFTVHLDGTAGKTNPTCKTLVTTTAAALMPPGSHQANVGTFELLYSDRLIDDLTGAGPWSDWSHDDSGTVSFMTDDDSILGWIIDMTLTGTYTEQSGSDAVTWAISSTGIVGDPLVGDHGVPLAWFVRVASTDGPVYSFQPANWNATNCAIDVTSDPARTGNMESRVRVQVTF